MYRSLHQALYELFLDRAERGSGIAPEKLLRALLLQAFYTIRSERTRRKVK